MAYKKIYVSTPDVQNPAQLQRVVNNVQQNVEDEFDKINRISILSNNIIENVSINTTTILAHKLNRKPVGYIIIAKNANATIWNGTIDEQSITLNSSSNVTATIMVF